MVANIIVYYHDPVEVDPATSWTGLCQSLHGARRIHISKASDRRVVELFGYAQPDAVITVDGSPALSIEQTQMNPSGHNIPQRFSFHVRAAELGVPSILYYPEYSRRTFSDPNVRYAQIRVPLAQRRITQLYNIPALSVFWPTDNKTLLPDTTQQAHRNMASVAESLISNTEKHQPMLQLPEVISAQESMQRVVSKYAHDYDRNPSVRRLLPNGFATAQASDGISIDPPIAAKLFRTDHFLNSEITGSRTPFWNNVESQLMRRSLTMLFTGTANKARNDSEHPWPGYLTLLDILYLREDNGRSPKERIGNLVYRLPVSLDTFISRANQPTPPTPTFIADTFADLILLTGGAVAGRPIRGNTPARPILR